MYNFIVNKGSGKRRGEEFLNRITEFCDSKGIEYAVYPTEAKSHAEKIARELCGQGVGNITAIGGDGTFHEVLNGLTSPEKTTVGFVPAGRGNDFARAAKLSLKPIEAFGDVLRGETKRIDYIRCGDRRCLNVAGTGMDVDVLQAVIDKKNAISYYVSLVKCLLGFKPYHVRITARGETYEKDCIMVGIGNGVAIGGGMLVCPDAKIDDGKLDLMIAEKLDRGLIALIPKFIKGKHDKLPELKHYDIERAEIDTFGRPIQLDGEIYENTSFDCEIVKGGLTTYKVAADFDKTNEQPTAMTDDEIIPPDKITE